MDLMMDCGWSNRLNYLRPPAGTSSNQKEHKGNIPIGKRSSPNKDKNEGSGLGRKASK